MEDFVSDSVKIEQWTAFLRRTGLTDVPSEFKEIMLGIREFVEPIVYAASARETFRKRWSPGGPWA
jgi:hypothetical protein